jgi:hypothetical protein
MFGSDFSPILIPIVAIVGGLGVAAINAISRGRVRELEIRERIAMIERGMVPPPETDPNGFERRMHAVDRIQHRHVGPRFRAGGIMVMSVGFGLMAMLWSLGAEREGIGIGGFLVILGFGLLVNSLFSSARPPALPPPPSNGPADQGPGSASV